MDTTPTVGVSTSPTCTPPACKTDAQIDATLSLAILAVALVSMLLIAATKPRS